MAIPTLQDRIKKQMGNKVPPTGQPPAMQQPAAPSSAPLKSNSPAPGQSKGPSNAPAGQVPKPPQPKAGAAAPAPGVNAKMNSAPAKPTGRPGMMNKSLASGDVTQPSNRVTPIQGQVLPETPIPPTPVQKQINIIEYLKLMTSKTPTLIKAIPREPASQKNVMSAIKKIPIHPDHEITAKDKINPVRRKDIISDEPLHPEHEATAKEKPNVLESRRKASVQPKPDVPDIGVKNTMKQPAKFNMLHFMTHAVGHSAPMTNKIVSAGKAAMKPMLGKSETAVIPPQIDHEGPTQTQHKVMGTKVTNGGAMAHLEREYQKGVSAKHDPKLTAKRNKVMSQTAASLAHRNKSSTDPGIASFGRKQWEAIPTKDKLHHHIKGAIDKVKSKVRG